MVAFDVLLKSPGRTYRKGKAREVRVKTGKRSDITGQKGVDRYHS